ncbi:MAG: hypothetical protein ISS66_13450 [Desulfobacteraceae bacterium]|nr:hypothetical protein [Desulfobacteraceae bacterium]
MKILMPILLILVLSITENVSSEEFLGAPVIPQAKMIKKTEARLEMATNLSHDEVLKFYKKTLKEFPDIKYRNWNDVTYIEDDGILEWHSITISKRDNPTSIVIVKDSWTWIIGTLLLRYIAVFLVLTVLLLCLILSGNIISRSIKKAEGEIRKP